MAKKRIGTQREKHEKIRFIKKFSNQQLSDSLLAFNISKGLKFVPTPVTDANIYLHHTPTLVRLRTFRKTYAPKRYNGFHKLYEQANKFHPTIKFLAEISENETSYYYHSSTRVLPVVLREQCR